VVKIAIVWLRPWDLFASKSFGSEAQLSSRNLLQNLLISILAFDMITMHKKVVKVAAIQAAPVSFDLEKSIEKVSEFTAEAARSGADLIVFPYVDL
jgi:hypothetical protein